jgi:hypothetical protein
MEERRPGELPVLLLTDPPAARRSVSSAASDPCSSSSTLGCIAWLLRGLAMDKRSLAFWRVAISCVILLDVLDRLTDLRQHYTDEGTITRSLILEHFDLRGYVSVYMISGTVSWALLMFFFKVVWAVGLLVGYKTFWMNLLSWYWEISLQIRAPIVLHNGDVYVRMVMFWMLFLPVGEFCSVDAWLKMANPPRGPGESRKTARDYVHFAVENLGMICQICFVYSISVIHKYQLGYNSWFEEGSSTYWALASLPYYRTWLGDIFVQLPRGMLRAMTYAVLSWEFLGPWFLFSPILTPYAKLVGVTGIFALHAGFGACMKLEQFVWIGCTASTCFLPPLLWDVILPAVRRRLGSCNNQTGHLFYSPEFTSLAKAIDAMFLIPSSEFHPLEATDERHLSFRCAELGIEASGFDAVVTALWFSPTLWPLALPFRHSDFLRKCGNVWFELQWPPRQTAVRAPLSVPLPAWIVVSPPATSPDQGAAAAAVSIADPVPQSSYAMPASVPSPEDKPKRSLLLKKKRPLKALIRACGRIPWRAILAVFFVTYSILWVFANLHFVDFPQVLVPIAHPIMLFQSWQMFSPPPRNIYYHTIQLYLDDGRQGSLIPNGGLWYWSLSPMSWEPPYPLYPNYGNHRHWKAWESFNWNQNSEAIRLEFGRWICREWNTRHSGADRLKRHQTYYTYYPVPQNDETPQRKRLLFWDHVCY